MNATKFAYAAAILLGVGLIAVIVRLNMSPASSGVSFETLPENEISTSTESNSSTSPATNTVTETPENTVKLQATDVKKGEGAEAVNGKSISVHYVGTLEDGTKFDSSRDRGTPFTFTLGAGEVIRGWDLGVAGMKVGGVRKLTIPAELAYGERAMGKIPANSTLLFEVELLGVE